MRDQLVRVEPGEIVIGPPGVLCLHLTRQQNYLDVSIRRGDTVVQAFILTEAELERLVAALALLARVPAIGPDQQNVRCEGCEAAGLPIPDWVTRWERSLAIQRALRTTA